MLPYTELRVWKDAHAWVLEVYRLTRRFPPEERYALTSQLRRSAMSVPGNIAEGSKRRTAADYARFVNIAEGSLGEGHYQLLLAGELGYADTRAALRTADEIGAMLHGLRTKLESAGAARN